MGHHRGVCRRTGAGTGGHRRGWRSIAACNTELHALTASSEISQRPTWRCKTSATGPACSTPPLTASPYCPTSRNLSSSHCRNLSHHANLKLCRRVPPTGIGHRVGPTVLKPRHGTQVHHSHGMESGLSKAMVHSSAQTAGSLPVPTYMQRADWRWLTPRPYMPGAESADFHHGGHQRRRGKGLVRLPSRVAVRTITDGIAG